MCIRFLLLSALLVATGCTHQQPLQVSEADRLAQFNAKAAERTVTVTLHSGGRHSARALRLAPDSTSWLVPKSNEVVSVPTYDVADVRLRNHGRGALNGLGGGAVGAGVLGALIGLASGSEEEPCLVLCSAGEKAVTLGVGLGLVGGVLGLVAGAASGSEDVYQVETTETTGSVFRERDATPDR
jgi:hypothetical protein